MTSIKWFNNSNGKTCPQRIGSTTLVTTLQQKALESADYSGSGAVLSGSGDSKPVGLPLGQVTITSGARSQNWAGKSTGLRNNGPNAMVVKVTPMEVKFPRPEILNLIFTHQVVLTVRSFHLKLTYSTLLSDPKGPPKRVLSFRKFLWKQSMKVI